MKSYHYCIAVFFMFLFLCSSIPSLLPRFCGSTKTEMQDVTEKEKKEAGEKTESGVKEFVCGEYNIPVATLCVEIKNAASIITHQPYCGEIHLSVITPPPEYIFFS